MAQHKATPRTGRIALENGKDWINRGERALNGESPFFERRMVPPTSQLILNPDIPISERRDKTTTANGGTVTQVDAEYRLRATTTSNSTAKLESRQRGIYPSGAVLEPGMGIRIPTQPTGDAFIKWGYYNGNEGIRFKYDANGVTLEVLRGGSVDQSFLQGTWSIDNLDGTGPSGGTLDVSEGHIYNMPFMFYGYGGIQWNIGTFNRSGRYAIHPVHHYKPTGQTSIKTPNLPITVEVDSGTTGVQLDCYVGGRQIKAYGGRDKINRSVAADRLEVGSIGTSFVPLVSVRQKSAFKNIDTSFLSLEMLSDADLVFEVHRNAVLDGASFGTPGNHTASEIATEWDISATSTYTPGETVFEGFVDAGTKTSLRSADVPNRPMNEDDTYTLAVRRVSGTNATASGLMRVQENW